MKRADNLFERITDFNNLRSAYLKAVKGKRYNASSILFDQNADSNLRRLKYSLENNTYRVSPYRQFKIYDPKERLITAASFEDRIVHHAIMNILEPVFERQFISHTYACRKNKGSHKAVFYCYKKARTAKYFLKLDVRKYFDSISHVKLKQLLCKIIKDKKCLYILFEIIDSYPVREVKGLPIGNLTSQFFANYYLSGLDHFVLELLKPAGYVRYMDDIIVFSDSKSELRKILNQMMDYVKTIDLTFKQPVINNCKNGVPFLGYLVTNNTIKLLKKNKNRKYRKLKELDNEYKKSDISEIICTSRYNCIKNVIVVENYF